MNVLVPTPKMRCEECRELVERWWFTGDRKRWCADCITFKLRLAEIARR